MANNNNFMKKRNYVLRISAARFTMAIQYILSQPNGNIVHLFTFNNNEVYNYGKGNIDVLVEFEPDDWKEELGLRNTPKKNKNIFRNVFYENLDSVILNDIIRDFVPYEIMINSRFWTFAAKSIFTTDDVKNGLLITEELKQRLLNIISDLQDFYNLKTVKMKSWYNEYLDYLDKFNRCCLTRKDKLYDIPEDKYRMKKHELTISNYSGKFIEQISSIEEDIPNYKHAPFIRCNLRMGEYKEYEPFLIYIMNSKSKKIGDIVKRYFRSTFEYIVKFHPKLEIKIDLEWNPNDIIVEGLYKHTTFKITSNGQRLMIFGSGLDNLIKCLESVEIDVLKTSIERVLEAHKQSKPLVHRWVLIKPEPVSKQRTLEVEKPRCEKPFMKITKMQKPKENSFPQPHYSGGIPVDNLAKEGVKMLERRNYISDYDLDCNGSEDYSPMKYDYCSWTNDPQ